jgi:hypothetical protein
LGGAVLGDAQLTKRLLRLADDLSSNPTKSIPVACAGAGGIEGVAAAGQRGTGQAGGALYDIYLATCAKEFEIIFEQTGKLLKKCIIVEVRDRARLPPHSTSRF